MWKKIKIVFGYLNLDLYLNLNFKVINLKCLNFISNYWNISYGLLKIYGLGSYFKFYSGFVKSKSMCPNLVIQSHTMLFSMYVGLEKNCGWFNLQWIRLCHAVIALTYPLGKVDPHGLFGIVA